MLLLLDGVMNYISNRKAIAHVITVLVFSMIYTIYFENDEYGDIHDPQDTLDDDYPFFKWLDRLYYTVNIQSTVGLGDVYPKSRRVRYVTLLQIIIVMVIFIVRF